MVWFASNRYSLTGSILYSDMTWTKSGDVRRAKETTFLNKVSTLPVVGIIAGVARAVLAIFHIIGHIFAGLIFLDRRHYGHVIKGFAELLRGLIEATPIIGRIFANVYHPSYFLPDPYPEKLEGCECFLVKIYNDCYLDDADRIFAKNNDHPFLNKNPHPDSI